MYKRVVLDYLLMVGVVAAGRLTVQVPNLAEVERLRAWLGGQALFIPFEHLIGDGSKGELPLSQVRFQRVEHTRVILLPLDGGVLQPFLGKAEEVKIA